MQHPDWKGGQPQRFSGGRKHLSQEGQLGHHLQPSSVSYPFGIRTFQQQMSSEHSFRPCLKTYDENYRSSRKQIELGGMKHLVLPEQVERQRRERGHVQGGSQTMNEHEPKGIRAYSSANQSKGQEYKLESKLQAKLRILGLEGQRNGMGVSSLGDKPYNYPEYESAFYKAGGLIPGSTGFNLRVGENTLPDPSKLKSIFTKPMWTEKVKMQEKEEDRTAIDSVDEWERTILKQANPKWNDPDTFFQRMQKVGNVGGKEVKKGAKK